MSADDTARLDWLNADAQRFEDVFGAIVRNEENGDVRAIIDAMRTDASRAADAVDCSRSSPDAAHTPP